MSEAFRHQQQHILTVGLDDYYHSAALKGSISRSQWYRFESRLERNALRTLELLDETSTKATFFVTGSVAEKCPSIVHEVARRGHEIASQGYCHNNARRMTRAEFRDDLRRARGTLEHSLGLTILGNRCARPLISTKDLWALDVLVEEGYLYDSSLLPLFRTFRREPWRRFVHAHNFEGRSLWEFPFSTWNCLGVLLPIAGGVYLRQIPYRLHNRSLQHWSRTYQSPFVMYFHVWELDGDQPRINVTSPIARIRHYRNLGKTDVVVRRYLKQHRFGSISHYLNISPEVQRAREFQSAPATQEMAEVFSQAAREEKTSVTIVVPFFNEEAVLRYFSNTLENLEKDLGATYTLHFVLVDDGSSDRTGEMLRSLFGRRSNCTVLCHPQNLGVAAAIMTGIRHARTEIVCSMDSDCTYDPSQFKRLIPELIPGIDLVTASPYHPEGAVIHVPKWRLSLSWSASLLYRLVLRQKLRTYTACFRVYRRSVVSDVSLHEQGFLGMPEMIGKLDLSGRRVCEVPATLEARLLGRSKMKLLPVILGHLGLMARLLWRRLSSPVQALNIVEPDGGSPIKRITTRPIG